MHVRTTVKKLVEDNKLPKDLADMPANGCVTFEQFSIILDDVTKVCEGIDAYKELTQAFNVFDGGSDGMVNVDQLTEALTTMGEKMEEQEIQALIKQVNVEKERMVLFMPLVEKLVGKRAAQ